MSLACLSILSRLSSSNTSGCRICARPSDSARAMRRSRGMRGVAVE